MPTIQLLPIPLINKIAAGEVLERPASAVKELVENALDAGARRIVVELEDGGRELIRVVDDGFGIPRDQLPLAVASHATSKLTSADDLFCVRTLGFRGEALASIAGVSDLILRSRPLDQPTGAQIEVHQGLIDDPRDCGCPVGTQVEVRGLFASVPVRRKFLKAKATELGHAMESVTRLALSHPLVGFTVVHNGRTVLDRQAGVGSAADAGLLLGTEVGSALLPIQAEVGAYKLTGYACHPAVDRPNGRSQYFFVNGRWFRDRSLGHALQEAYRGLLMTGRYPIAIVFLDIPPDEVDVNVHPQKCEVRFVEPHRLFSMVLGSVRQRFLKSDLTGNWNTTLPSSHATQALSVPSSLPGSLPGSLANLSAGRQADAAPFLDRMVDEAGRTYVVDHEGEFHLVNESPGQTGSLWDQATESTTSPNPGPMEGIEGIFQRPKGLMQVASVDNQAAHASTRRPALQGPPPTVDSPRHAAEHYGRAFQLHNSYIVVETSEGMLLIDQHALHERILYEEMKQRVTSGALEAQELLTPEPVELPPIQVGLLLEHRDLLAKLGLDVEEFGERTLLVRSQPVLMQSTPAAELLRNIAGELEEAGTGPSQASLLNRVLSTAACKAAVKAGDPLTAKEIEALLSRRRLVEDSHHCPHGRPTILKFTLQDLEKQFKRI